MPNQWCMGSEECSELVVGRVQNMHESILRASCVYVQAVVQILECLLASLLS